MRISTSRTRGDRSAGGADRGPERRGRRGAWRRWSRPCRLRCLRCVGGAGRTGSELVRVERRCGETATQGAPPGRGRVLLTGGTGRLGTELCRLIGGLTAPTHAEMDVTDSAAVDAFVGACRPDVIVHAAAFTNVSAAERDRELCWHVNVRGTRNIVRASMDHHARLVHISTDYVFDGGRGMYEEDDVPGPVCNFYALSKLAAEEMVRLAPRSLVIRTSFRPREWPYPTAFTDVYTSQDYVDVIAPEIALAVTNLGSVPDGTLHIATERKSVYELARRRRPDVRAGTRDAAGVVLPADISLNVSRWQSLRQLLRVRSAPES